MKKWILAPLVALALSGCGTVPSIGGLLNFNLDGAYRVDADSFGYYAEVERERDDDGNIIFEQVTLIHTDVRFTVLARAGAPDLLNLRYSATLLDGEGVPVFQRERERETAPVVADPRQQISGTITTLMQGGYRCPNTADTYCMLNEREFVNRTEEFVRAVSPANWARHHYYNGVPAGYRVRVRYEADASGRPVTWVQEYPYVYPFGE